MHHRSLGRQAVTLRELRAECGLRMRASAGSRGDGNLFVHATHAARLAAPVIRRRAVRVSTTGRRLICCIHHFTYASTARVSSQVIAIAKLRLTRALSATASKSNADLLQLPPANSSSPYATSAANTKQHLISPPRGILATA